MGGAVDVPGNVTEAAEFNIWSDPEAAAVVLGSGIPVTLVGLDVTRRVQVQPGEMADAATPVIRRLLQAQARNRPEVPLSLHDPLTVIAVAAPELLTLEAVRLTVDTSGGPGRGRTRRGGAGAVTSLATGVDAAGALRLFRERVLEAAFSPTLIQGPL